MTDKNPGRSIMVAVQNVDRSSIGLLRKAAALAGQRGARLHLLHVIAWPYTPPARAGVDARSLVRDAIRDSKAELEKLAKSPELRGLNVRVTVEWDYPASDAIVRQVMKHRPQMLIVESRRHARLARALLTNTDWDLIRHCPCPLLLSKTARTAARPIVVAALDPFHAHAKPASLDRVILETAIEAAGARNRVYAIHAHETPISVLADGGFEPYWIPMAPEQIAELEAKNRKVLEREARRVELPADNVVYVRGNVVEALPRAAKRLRADVVVMGAVSRSGLKRLFIGNSAERLLDKLDCDVLVVKPRRFTSPVPRRAARLVPYPPYPLM